MKHCQRCHDCGDRLIHDDFLRPYCARCREFRFYASHGFNEDPPDLSVCWTVAPSGMLLRPIKTPENRAAFIEEGNHRQDN